MKIQSQAIVNVPNHGPRPAALAFLTPDGAAWVEPAYLFPEPVTMPAFHRVIGSVSDQAEGFTVTTADGQAYTFNPPKRGHDDDESSCALALADWSDLLVELGRSESEEHAAIAAQLRDELA
jgi:hypothetical protein